MAIKSQGAFFNDAKQIAITWVIEGEKAANILFKKIIKEKKLKMFECYVLSNEAIKISERITEQTQILTEIKKKSLIGRLYYELSKKCYNEKKNIRELLGNTYEIPVLDKSGFGAFSITITEDVIKEMYAFVDSMQLKL